LIQSVGERTLSACSLNSNRSRPFTQTNDLVAAQRMTKAALIGSLDFEYNLAVDRQPRHSLRHSFCFNVLILRFDGE